MTRDQRYEQRAFVNLLLDLQVPSIATTQFAAVQPYFDASDSQGLADACRRVCILGSIREEDGTRRLRLLRHKLKLTRESRVDDTRPLHVDNEARGRLSRVLRRYRRVAP